MSVRLMWLILLSALLPFAVEPSVSAGQVPCSEWHKWQTVYITGPMNVRKSPTTSSPVVMYAVTGAYFNLIQKTSGGGWCWLKIRFGNSGSGWIAVTKWVEAGPRNRFLDPGVIASPTTAPSDIDNCCFVDRQCRTEQEWIDGYWAYQNRQCVAQAQIPVANLSRPRIEGSEAYVHKMNEVLNLMESKSPALYQYVVSVTSLITEHGPDRCDWGLAYKGTGRASLGTCLVLGGYGVYGIAAVLAHEACHLHHDDIDPVTGEYDHERCFLAGSHARDALTAGTPYR